MMRRSVAMAISSVRTPRVCRQRAEYASAEIISAGAVMTKSVDESSAPVWALDTEAFPVPDKTPLKDGVHSAKEEGAIQVQVEVTATRLGKVGAGMARAFPIPTNGVVDTLALRLDGPQPVRERLSYNAVRAPMVAPNR